MRRKNNLSQHDIYPDVPRNMNKNVRSQSQNDDDDFIQKNISKLILNNKIMATNYYQAILNKLDNPYNRKLYESKNSQSLKKISMLQDQQKASSQSPYQINTKPTNFMKRFEKIETARILSQNQMNLYGSEGQKKKTRYKLKSNPNSILSQDEFQIPKEDLNLRKRMFSVSDQPNSNFVLKQADKMQAKNYQLRSGISQRSYVYKEDGNQSFSQQDYENRTNKKKLYSVRNSTNESQATLAPLNKVKLKITELPIISQQPIFRGRSPQNYQKHQEMWSGAPKRNSYESSNEIKMPQTWLDKDQTYSDQELDDQSNQEAKLDNFRDLYDSENRQLKMKNHELIEKPLRRVQSQLDVPKSQIQDNDQIMERSILANQSVASKNNETKNYMPLDKQLKQQRQYDELVEFLKQNKQSVNQIRLSFIPMPEQSDRDQVNTENSQRSQKPHHLLNQQNSEKLQYSIMQEGKQQKLTTIPMPSQSQSVSKIYTQLDDQKNKYLLRDFYEIEPARLDQIPMPSLDQSQIISEPELEDSIMRLTQIPLPHEINDQPIQIEKTPKLKRQLFKENHASTMNILVDDKPVRHTDRSPTQVQEKPIKQTDTSPIIVKVIKRSNSSPILEHIKYIKRDQQTPVITPTQKSDNQTLVIQEKPINKTETIHVTDTQIVGVQKDQVKDTKQENESPMKLRENYKILRINLIRPSTPKKENADISIQSKPQNEPITQPRLQLNLSPRKSTILSQRSSQGSQASFSGLTLQNQGIALQNQGRNEEAMNCYKLAIEANSKKVIARINLGALLIQHNQNDQAISVLNEAIRLAPNNAEAHYYMGVALRNKNELEAALSCFQSATQLEGVHGLDYVQKADLEFQLNQYAQSNLSLQRASSQLQDPTTVKAMMDELLVGQIVIQVQFILDFWQNFSKHAKELDEAKLIYGMAQKIPSMMKQLIDEYDALSEIRNELINIQFRKIQESIKFSQDRASIEKTFLESSPSQKECDDEASSLIDNLISLRRDYIKVAK